MEIAPLGTVDPSPFLYNTSMYVFAGLIGAAGLMHMKLTDVNPKYFEEN